jgi:3-deoxy-D-manno-octulosonate 8-phosphate phosphatase KdsC-like HAD superfamily phosphatase
VAEPTGAVADLHAGVGELTAWLRDAVRRADATDAFLLACGVSQVVEDWWESTDSNLRRLTVLAGERGAARRGLRIGVDASNTLLRAAAGHAASCLRADAGQSTAALADLVVARLSEPSEPRPLPQPALDLVHRLSARAASGRLPARLAAALARPPSCFRSFDQHPRDCVELARRFALEYDLLDTPVLVLGVRTSGAYLAPLIAAALRASGIRGAQAATVRPGGPLPKAVLRRAGNGAVPGIVAVVDDPPTTGGSMAEVVNAVRGRGFPASRVVALYASFDGGTPRRLPADLPRIVLPPEAWHIRTLLDQAAVGSLVRAALPGAELVDVHSEAPGLPTRDRHLAVRVNALVRTDAGSLELEFAAEGAGTGYFGRHAAEVAERLAGRVPEVLAVHDGVLLRSDGRATPARAAEAADVAAYVAARAERLRVAEDRSASLRGRQPAWEISARILSAGFGRLAPAVRPFLIDPALRRLLPARDPSLTDGRTAISEWIAQPGDGARKTEFDEGCFSHLDLACYDPAFDLAGAAILRPGDEDALVEAYAALGGARIDPARWYVYQCVQAWNLERVGPTAGLSGATADPDPRQARARAAQRFFGDLFLGDLEIEPEGPCVVLDVDGVLELDFGGTPSPTLATMHALRALRAHGYRVVLATGRSIPEVRDRCAAYRLLGGVGEYGCATYVAENDDVATLPEAAAVDGARKALMDEVRGMPGLGVDELYRNCVRVFGSAPGGGRRGPGEPVLHRLAVAHPAFVPVPGQAQADFVPAAVDKSLGLRTLLKELGAAQEPVALAVGDATVDLGMLRMAELGFVPAHAPAAVRAPGVTRTRAPYQAGLAEAVGRLLGHRPGGCALCAPPRLAPAERLVATLLSVGENGRRGLAPALARLAALRAGRAEGRLRAAAGTGDAPWR